MEQTRHVAEWVNMIGDSAVEANDATVRAGLGVAPPTVHVLVDGLDPAYVGKLGCRPFYPGSDAREAVAVMGLVGSMLGATRLVITYEHADMARAFDDLGADRAPTGIAVIDAGPTDHSVAWHPARFTEDPAVAGLLPLWGQIKHFPDGRLPWAVAQLLKMWRAPRSWTAAELVRVLVGWETSGYSIRWVTRPDGEQHQPGWMRLLAPIM